MRSRRGSRPSRRSWYGSSGVAVDPVRRLPVASGRPIGSALARERSGGKEGARVGDHPLLPDYGGACIASLVPALLEPGPQVPAWLPAAAVEADQVVLLVLDGLGWDQLQERRHLAPTLSAMAGGPITSVTPTTTATALTSIATGLTPGEHGVVGYRVAVDARGAEHPALEHARPATPVVASTRRSSSPTPPSCGHRVAVVTKAEFATSGFSGAHLSRGPLQRLPGALHPGDRDRPAAAGRRAVPLRLLRRGRQGLPRVRPGRPLRRRGRVRRPPGRRRARGAAPRRRRWSSPPTTARSTSATTSATCTPTWCPTCRSSRARGASAGCTPAPAGPRPCTRRPRPTTPARPGSSPGTRRSRSGWWGPSITDAARARLGDVALVAREPVSLPRRRRLGPLRPGRAARLADLGRDARALPRRHRLSDRRRPDGGRASAYPGASRPMRADREAATHPRDPRRSR